MPRRCDRYNDIMVPVFTAELEAQVLRGLDESDIDAATARSPAAVRVVW